MMISAIDCVDCVESVRQQHLLGSERVPGGGIDALSRLDDVSVIAAEYFGASDIPQLESCLRLVDDADCYVLILGHRYGFIPPGHDVSITELEFQRARDRAIPVLAFTLSPDAPVPLSSIESNPRRRDQLAAFKDSLRWSTAVSVFRSADHLAASLATSIANLIHWKEPSRPPSRDQALARCRNEVKQQKGVVDDLAAKLRNTVPAQPIWRGRKFHTDELLCFALLPFQDAFLEVYESAVAPAAQEIGLRALHAGEIFGTREVVEDIWDSICSSRVVADVTGRNPSVFYELGILPYAWERVHKSA